MTKQMALCLTFLFSLKILAQKPVIALEKMNALYMYIPKNGDAVDLYNEGANLNAKNREVMQRAKVGDVFQFQVIKLKCPWDCGIPSVPPLNYVVKN